MKPLANVTVCDLSHTVAGPVCTHLLSGLGASVIKVEPPAGDMGREMVGGAMYDAYNHGKKSICVDLDTEKGQEVVQRIVEESDVLVENFRPDTLSKFDLDYDSVTVDNPDLVYCSLSGFGQDGPYAEFPAYDPVIQAMSGVMDITGPADGDPCRIGVSALDASTGFLAAFLISSSLFRKEADGDGTFIDVSLFDTALYWLSFRIIQYFNEGKKPKRQGAGLHGHAPYDTYATGDDEQVLVCTPNDKLFSRFGAVIDREDLIAEERFATNESRWTHRDELREELEREFEDYTARELSEKLAKGGVPAGVVQGIDDIVENDSHVSFRDMLVPPPDRSETAAYKSSALPFRIGEETTDTESSRYESAPPKLGEHTSEVLRSVGYTAEEIPKLFADEVIYSE